MAQHLSRIFFLIFIIFTFSTKSAFACNDYAETYICTSKIVKRAKLNIQKEFVDDYSVYKFELSIGPFFKKEYYFVDDNQWITFDKTNINATFTSKTRCEGHTLISETYTDYKNWSKRVYDDIQIIENPDSSLTINTQYWTEKPNKTSVKKPYTWNCK